MKIHRTKNTARNVLWGFLYKGLMILLPFVTRTAILKILGEQYLGLNGLFTSILAVLNMADLGFGTAVVYSMYKPIAEDDTDAICALLSFYKKAYRIIGCVVFFGGLLLLPFLKFMIKGDVPDAVNIYIIYLIYLFNTAASYWLFAYKSSLFSAHQRNDISSKVNSTVVLIQYLLQLCLLFVFKNYYFYLFVMPILTVVRNISIAVMAKKYYPLYSCRGKISANSRKEIRKQIGGLFLSKVCGTTRNSLDSIFISAYLGLREVAVYGNYFYILNCVHEMMSIISSSMLGGIGNSIAKETVQKNYTDFKKITFLYAWMSGWCTCCLLSLYQPFMRIWVGDKLLFPFPVMILFCIYFYFLTATDIRNIYIDACGCWWENRGRSILETLLNLSFNMILGYYFGVYGILTATLITVLFVNFPYGTVILFRSYFKKQNIKEFFLMHLFYFLVTAAVAAITYFICALLPADGLSVFVLKCIICIIVPNILFLLCYFKTSAFITAKPLVKSVLDSAVRKIRG